MFNLSRADLPTRPAYPLPVYGHLDDEVGRQVHHEIAGLVAASPRTPGGLLLDFAYDERLPEAPVPVWTAGPELSLAWKLRWLAAGHLVHRVSAWKDLYDAVLLAELDGVRLSPRLRSVALDTSGGAGLRAGGAGLGAGDTGAGLRADDAGLQAGGADLWDPAIRGWIIDSGDEAVPWLERFAEAAPRLLTDEGNER